MLVKTQLLNELKDLGMNLYESKLWTALLSRGVATAGELSDIANVPRSRTYDVLESLERKGFIMTKLGKPIRYIALSPEQVIDRVHKNIVEETKQKEENIKRLEDSDVLGELTKLHTQGITKVDSFDLSGTLKGRKNIYNHLNYLIKNAKKTIVLATTEDGLKRKHESFSTALKGAASRGVDITIAVPKNKNTKKYTDELAKIATINHSDTTTRLCVVDSKDAVLMLTNDTDVNPIYDNAVWISSEFLANALNIFLSTSKE